MSWSKNYFNKLDRTHYELIDGVVYNKLRGIWLDGISIDTGMIKENIISTKESVPKDYWKDYIELMSFIYDDEKTVDECDLKLKEIISRGRIKEGCFVMNFN